MILFQSDIAVKRDSPAITEFDLGYDAFAVLGGFNLIRVGKAKRCEPTFAVATEGGPRKILGPSREFNGNALLLRSVVGELSPSVKEFLASHTHAVGGNG